MDHQFVVVGQNGQHQQQENNQQNRRGAGDAHGGGGGGGDGGDGGGDGGGGGQNNNNPPPQPCPRCDSKNTKFCYYNNYSLSQPRFFCKGCRRYWTQGGTLRNVPVGGGCRKSKRPKLSGSSSGSASASASASSSMPLPPIGQQHQHQHQHQYQHQLPVISSAAATTAAAAVVGNHNNNNNNMFFGRGNSAGYFMSSLAAMQQGVNVSQPLTFGPNLGLLHGFSLPSFQTQQNNQQDQLFQNMYSIRDIAGSSSSSAGDWNLGVQPSAPIPPLPSLSETNNSNGNNNTNTNTNTNNNSSNSNTNNDQINQWADFMGNTGLDDP